MTSIVDMSLGISSGPRAVMALLADRPVQFYLTGRSHDLRHTMTEVTQITIQTRPYFQVGENGFIISMNPSPDGTSLHWINVAVTQDVEGGLLGRKWQTFMPYIAGYGAYHQPSGEFGFVTDNPFTGESAREATNYTYIHLGVENGFGSVGDMAEWVEKHLSDFYHFYQGVVATSSPEFGQRQRDAITAAYSTTGEELRYDS